MTGPAALQVLGGYLAAAVLTYSTRTGVGCPSRAALRPNAFLPTSPLATADNEQHNGKTYPSSSTACSVVSALLGLIPTFLPPCLHTEFQHRMKRRRRLERMEHALQTANRRTDHEFIQDFLLMLAKPPNARL